MMAASIMARKNLSQFHTWVCNCTACLLGSAASLQAARTHLALYYSTDTKQILNLFYIWIIPYWYLKKKGN